MSSPNRIIWGGRASFTHMLLAGPTRCGKTATVLKPMIYQLLKAKKEGARLGITVVEPKGDTAAMVSDMSAVMGLNCHHVDPLREVTGDFNVMRGELDDIIEATVVVLQAMFGRQDPFFSLIQEGATRNIITLLHRLHGMKFDLFDLVRKLRNSMDLQRSVAQLKEQEGQSELVQTFEYELEDPRRKEFYEKIVTGLRVQLGNITANSRLRPILQGRQNDFDLDRHYEEGGILAVNTGMRLRKAGDAFGQFVIMHTMSAAYRRPGTEDTRIPHYLIVDEASRYMCAEFERFLSIAAEYKTAGIFAVQSLGQLEVASGSLSGPAMKRAFLTSCRNRIAFVGLGSEDAKEFEEDFGKDPVTTRQATHEGSLVTPSIIPKSYRDTTTWESRIPATVLSDGLPPFHFVAKFVEDTPNGIATLRPKVGKGNFIPKNWKQLLTETERGGVATFANRQFNLLEWAKRNYKILVQKEDKSEYRGDLTVEELNRIEHESLLDNPDAEQPAEPRKLIFKAPPRNEPEPSQAIQAQSNNNNERLKNHSMPNEADNKKTEQPASQAVGDVPANEQISMTEQLSIEQEFDKALSAGRKARQQAEQAKNKPEKPKDDFFKDIL